jgi:hypothetical protein
VGRTLSGQRPLALLSGGAPAAIKDAEGLALAGDQVVVLGSHSRRSWDKKEPRCTLDGARLSFGRFRRDAGGLVGSVVTTGLSSWRQLVRPDGCRRELITPADQAGAALAAEVCAAIGDGQAHAEESAEGCSRAVNFEGVAAIPSGTGGSRIWFGLRGPVVGGQAVVLRLASAAELRFDAVATLDLGGDGVRDLAFARDWLWILAGPSADRAKPGSLWRVPAEPLTDGARLHPARVPGVPALPPFAEGLAIDPEGGGAFLLIDGDEERGPGDPNGCPIPSRYRYLALPDDHP